LENKLYFEETLIAETEPPVNGKTGEFHFFFNTEIDHKPKILEDGSVDYSTAIAVELVNEGDKIVEYIPGSKGIDGSDVCGNVIPAKPGKELPPIKGRGFHISEDKLSYFADMTGHIVYENEKITITNVLELKENVSHATGNIDFDGDVVIYGSVISGMEIRATGNININGYVEAATLDAGKHIFLQNGMQGGGKGKIRCKKTLTGKFFEQAEIRAGADVNANAFMNCNILTEGKVIAAGRMGSIVGGRVQGISGIEAKSIGNIAEVKMELIAGIDKTVVAKIGELEGKIKELRLELLEVQKTLGKVDQILKMEQIPAVQEKKRYLLRDKISIETDIKTLQEEEAMYERWRELSEEAKVVVHKSIYPGTRLTVNNVDKMITTENYNVTYRRRHGEVEFVANI
jgi:hypothetical protein